MLEALSTYSYAVCWCLSLTVAVVWWILLGLRRYRSAETAGLVTGTVFIFGALVTIGPAEPWDMLAGAGANIALLAILLAGAWLILLKQRNRRKRWFGWGALAALILSFALFGMADSYPQFQASLEAAQQGQADR